MLEARGGAGPQTWLVLLSGALTSGTHPTEHAVAAAGPHCTYLGGTVLRGVHAGHGREGPIGLLHIGWQLIGGGQLGKNPKGGWAAVRAATSKEPSAGSSNCL